MFKILSDRQELGKNEEYISPIDDFKKISESVATLIRNSDSRFSIGIYGEWGTGKTTLMRLIEQDLKKSDSRNDEQVIWSNLSQNDGDHISRFKKFLGETYQIEDPVLEFEKENKKTISNHRKIREISKNTKLLTQSRRRAFSALSFLLSGNGSKTIPPETTNLISIQLNTKNETATLKIDDYVKTLSAESKDGKINIYLEKEKEILTVWFDAWRYEPCLCLPAYNFCFFFHSQILIL